MGGWQALAHYNQLHHKSTVQLWSVRDADTDSISEWGMLFALVIDKSHVEYRFVSERQGAKYG